MPKIIKEYPLLPLFRKFINECKKGKHLQSNGKRIKLSSIQNYIYLEALLSKFSETKHFNIRLKNINYLTKKQFDDESKYWKEFYLKFTGYLYDDLGHYDNYVGRMVKLIRSFFNYLNNEKNLHIGQFHKKFYSPSEEIEILVLNPERLNHLISDINISNNLSQELNQVKDVFLFGCSVALRYSDLMSLTKANIETVNNRKYIRIQSKKTNTFTRVKLPDYAIEVLNKYNYSKKLLPSFNKVYMNKKVKDLMEVYGFTEPCEKFRQRRGIRIKQYKNKQKKIDFRFCDLITTHTMRRTAITNYLSEGLNEHFVRQISGHAANSKEFFRYVSFSQSFFDDEIDKVHEKISQKRLEIIQ